MHLSVESCRCGCFPLLAEAGVVLSSCFFLLFFLRLVSPVLIMKRRYRGDSAAPFVVVSQLTEDHAG